MSDSSRHPVRMPRILMSGVLAIVAAMAVPALAGPAKHAKTPVAPAAIDAAAMTLGERAFAQCKGCHSLQPGGTDMVGPALYGVYGKKAATNSASFAYSSALRAYGATWDDQSLSTFLQGPSKAVPGTKMPYRGLTDDATRSALVYYIKVKSSQK